MSVNINNTTIREGTIYKKYQMDPKNKSLANTN